MFRSRFAARLLLLGGLLTAGTPATVRGAVYPIEKFVEYFSDAARSHDLFGAAINDSGAVAYLGFLTGTEQPSTLYLARRAPDGTTTTVTIPREDYGGVIPGSLAISNAGTVTMAAQGLFRYSPDGTKTKVPYPVTYVGGFAASRTDDSLPVIVSGTGPSVPGGGVFNGPDPVANRLDNPAIHRFPSVEGLGAGGSPRFLARRPDDTMFVYKGPDPQADFVMDLSAYSKAASYRENARGDVLFTALKAGGGTGIFSGPDPVADRVLDNTTPLHPSGYYMNDVGQVVYRAYTGSVAESADHIALYASTDPADRIIGVGDTLFGSTVWEIGANGLDGAAFNNRGQLVFHYRLRDGRNGIAVVTVPEPAPAALALSLAIAAAAPRAAARLPQPRGG
jgi:hypothetical protein